MDPLSPPLLFNMAMYLLLRSFPNHIGVPIDSSRVNVAAFADDLLFAETKEELQIFFNHVSEVLQSLGLKVNIFKPFTISSIPCCKEKVRTNSGP